MVLTTLQRGYSQQMNREYEGGSAEYIMNGEIRILRASNEPCIICGEPGGNCAGELEPPKHLAGSNAFPSLGHEDTYVVPEDVWREVNISDKTKTRVLVAAKGVAMPLSKAKDLGLC